MSIDLNLSPEQQQILAAVAKAMSEEFPVSRLRGNRAASPDLARLPMLAALGCLGLGASEDLGGAGFSVVEDALLFAELGRYLITPSALATSLAARLATELGKAGLARDLIAGRTSACIANALTPFRLDELANLPVHLVDAQGASFAVLWNDEGIVLLDCQALAMDRIACMDRSVSLHRCKLVPAAVQGALAASATGLVRTAHLLVSCLLLGIAEATRDMAVAYANMRVQFGRPIGSFQAVKHRCADMALATESLRAQMVFAAIAERDAWPDAQFQNDALRLLAARHALANAAANIQVHGGIGFTAECDAHLYLLRAHLYEHLGGSQRAAQLRMATPPVQDVRPHGRIQAMEVP